MSALCHVHQNALNEVFVSCVTLDFRVVKVTVTVRGRRQVKSAMTGTKVDEPMSNKTLEQTYMLLAFEPAAILAWGLRKILG